MKKIPVGLQLYSIRHEVEKDLRGTLKAVAEMAYDGVEFFGYPKNSAEELRALLDEFGLACCGWHTPFELVQDDKLDETIKFNKILGNRYVIVPGLPGHLTKSREAWLKMADFFNKLAGKLAEYGMVTGYHNHHVEFIPLDGEQPWDTFFSNTGKGVAMQLDLGNALFGGADIMGILRRYPGRTTTIHLKPFSEKAAEENREYGFRPLIGDDEIDWNEVFRICDAGDTEWYIVEYESDAYPVLEAVAGCLKNIRAIRA